MIDQVRTRLAELEREFRAGEEQLAELLGQEASLRETLLRISGAVQILRELVADEDGAGSNGSGPDPGTGNESTGNGSTPAVPQGTVLTVP